MRRRRSGDPEVWAFWRKHVSAWMRSELSQLGYCERHGLCRTKFYRWRMRLKQERDREERKALNRGRRKLSHMTKAASHMTKVLFPAQLSHTKVQHPRCSVVRRRRFNDGEKRRIVAEANAPGACITDVAKRYGLAFSLLCRWRREFSEGPEPFSGFAAVTLADEVLPASSSRIDLGALLSAPSASGGGMEIVLPDGKRVRIEAGADPLAVKQLITVLEGMTP
jgi:transposase